MENKLLVAGIVIVAVAVIVLLAGVIFFFPLPPEGNSITVTGLPDFTVPESGALYAGATGNFRMTLKSDNKTLIVESIYVKVNGVTGIASPGIMMNPGGQNNFLVSDLPTLYPGQAYTAAVEVNYRDTETGLEAVSSGSITGRVS